MDSLKLEVHKSAGNTQVMKKSIAELRNFFIRHALQLQHEYQILGASDSHSHPDQSSALKTKLVLPGTKNPLWHQLLTGARLYSAGAAIGIGSPFDLRPKCPRVC